jgi:hypothetical protein
MNALRALFNTYPSGLTITPTGSKLLATDLQVLDSSCSNKLNQAFRIQELSPWLNYAPVVPAPTTKK